MSILVIDLGSSSVRALLFDEQARLIPSAVARRPHALNVQADGASTADPHELQRITEACIDDILAHPAAGSVQAVGMATLVGNVIGLDGAGGAITPLYTYADTRAADDVRMLRGTPPDRADLDAQHQRTGCPLHTAYLPARLHWARRKEPQRFAAVRQWADVGTYLYRAWFGRAVPCSYSVAAWTGLLNREALRWDEGWLGRLGMREEDLPPLGDYSASQNGLATPYALRWPFLRDVPFFLAVGDGAAANVGSGAVGAGQAAITIGTTAALRKIIIAAPDQPAPPVPAGLWGYRVDAPRHLIGGATSEGGNLFAWAGQTLQLPAPADLERDLARRTPGQHGLTVTPLLAGERSPGWRPDATGTIHGLRLSTTAVDIVQALMEALALQLTLIARRLLHPADTLIGSGAALTGSPALAQTVCNAIGHNLALLSEDELTARGVAVLALEAVHRAPLSLPAPAIARILHPDPAAAERLQACLRRQEALYAVLPETVPE